MDSTFTYIVCCYFGSRANQKYNSIINNNKFFFVDKHIEFLRKYTSDRLKKVIFVVNNISDKDTDLITSHLQKSAGLISDGIDIELTFRENRYFSYGAWNDAICVDLEEEFSTDYYFCLEDDYIPYTSDFVEPFIKKCEENTPYVCSRAVINHEHYIDHASMSVGLFLKSACKNVFDKNGQVFLLDGDNSYQSAWKIQQTFYKPFLDMGYKITDIADEYTFPFLDSATNEIKNFGKRDSKVLVGPVLE